MGTRRGAKLARLIVLYDLNRLWERSLVVNEELDENIVVGYHLKHQMPLGEILNGINVSNVSK